MNGLPVRDFKVGDKVMLANPFLSVGSNNHYKDTFTVISTELFFGKWLVIRNDRTGECYVMSDGECRKATD